MNDNRAGTTDPTVPAMERRTHRFRIEGDPAEAMKVVLARQVDDED